jgi:hypothetical protein
VQREASRNPAIPDIASAVVDVVADAEVGDMFLNIPIERIWCCVYIVEKCNQEWCIMGCIVDAGLKSANKDPHDIATMLGGGRELCVNGCAQPPQVIDGSM